jgi:site-specific DNA-adenine methylase
MNEHIKYFFGRYGNKLIELKHFENYLPAYDYKTYVEPYAGSFGTLRGIYMNLSNDVKIHLNDTDVLLLEQYRWILEVDIKIVELMINMMDAYFYKNMYVGGNNPEGKLFYGVIEELKTEGIPDNILFAFQDSILHMGLMKTSRYLPDFIHLRNLLQRCHITELDAINNIFEMYKEDKDAFLFCDPPYLDTNTKQYGRSNKRSDLGKKLQDNSNHYIGLLNLLRYGKCKVMGIINKTYLTEYLFKDFIKGEYNKCYGASKSRTIHIILTNY